MPPLRVVLEIAPKRAFASALDWPGWSRGAKGELQAIETLLAYGPRYAAVAARADIPLDAARVTASVEVVERLTGSSGTEFGVPSHPAAEEAAAIADDELQRLVALLRAAWDTFDAGAAAAAGRPLRLGPRGGGRSVAKIVEHVAEAESAYLRQLGARAASEHVETVRDAFVEALAARASGRPVATPSRVRSPWLPRYAVRRSAWHAIDHAWEIEDRSISDDVRPSG